MAKCPVCEIQVKGEEQRLCSQCGWEFRYIIGGISEQEENLYQKKLEIARRNWHDLQMFKTQQNRNNGTASGIPEEKELETIADEQADSLYSEKTPVPDLKRDPFETFEEFKERIKGHKPIPAGTATLIKEKYDIRTGVFPLEISWDDRIKDLEGIPSADSELHVNAERDLARAIYEDGPKHCLFVRLGTEEEKVFVDTIELYAENRVIPIPLTKKSEPPDKEKKRKKDLKYNLRSTPITVSVNEVIKVFRLNSDGRPLKYMKNEFEDNGDGTITDHATGLTWQKSGLEVMNYKKAQTYVKLLNSKRSVGYSDWRLPTIEELMSLLESEKQSDDLYINPIFDRTQRWCQSSDIASSNNAWLVSFALGNVGRSNKTDSYYVRCVRSGQ